MLNRIKTYIRDNETEALVIATGVNLAVIAAGLLYFKVDGEKIRSATPFVDEDGVVKAIDVLKKNGKITTCIVPLEN